MKSPDKTGLLRTDDSDEEGRTTNADSRNHDVTAYVNASVNNAADDYDEPQRYPRDVSRLNPADNNGHAVVSQSQVDWTETETETETPAAPPVTYSVSRARWTSTVALFLYCMGGYHTSSIISQYLQHRWSEEANFTGHSSGSVCFKNDSDPRQKEEDHIQARVSTALMYYNYSLLVPAILVSVVMGVYSDVIGRRIILIIPLAATILNFITFIIIIRFKLNTDFFFLAYAIEGVGGSMYVVLIASFAITADINASKTSRVLWINVLISFNQIVSGGFNIANGVIIDQLGFQAAILVSLVPLVMSLSLAVFLLPETRPTKSASAAGSGGSGSFNFRANAERFVKLFLRDGSRRHRIALAISLVLFFFAVIDLLNKGSMDTLYQMRHPLCWDATHIGYYKAVSGGAYSIAGVLYQAATQRIGCLTDEKVAMIGLLFQAGAFVLEAFMKNAWMMYLVPVVAVPSFPCVGIIRGITSLLAGPYNQGAAFASIALVEVICGLASNTAIYRIYASTVDSFAGAVYLLMAAFCFLDFFIFIVFFRFYDDRAKTPGGVNVQDDGDQERKTEKIA